MTTRPNATMSDRTSVIVHLERRERAQLKALAAARGRSLSNMTRTLIQQALRRARIRDAVAHLVFHMHPLGKRAQVQANDGLDHPVAGVFDDGVVFHAHAVIVAIVGPPRPSAGTVPL